MTENDYYSIPVKCKNCNYTYEVNIPQGIKYEDVKCENCRLKELEKQMPNSFEPDPGICI